MTAIRITGLSSGPQTIEDQDLVALANGADVVDVAAVLDAVEVPERTTHCTAISERGAYRASIPLDDIRRGGRLTVRNDGVPLPTSDGGPYRLKVVDGTTLCWNVKGVEELRLSAGPLPDDVPENPPH